MSHLPQRLLSLALRVKWEVGYRGEKQALRALAERMPGLDTELYAEAFARASAMNDEAWRLADAWHDSKGSAYFSRDDLAPGHPGFALEDYEEAISNNLLWARK
jgi:hypothetical protein